MSEASTQQVSPIPQTILVVDDDESICALLSQALEGRGYEVATATSARSALDLARRLAPDLVLLDLVLPDLSGAQLCAELRALPEGSVVPIVVLSGQIAREGLLEALDRGADDFLRKPIEMEELLARVASHLRSRHSRQRFAQAFAATDAPQFILGAAAAVIDLNRAGEALLPQRREEVLGKSFAHWLSSEDGPRLDELVARVRGGGSRHGRLSFAFQGAGTEKGRYEASLVRLSSATPEILLTLRPVSEHQQLEAELARTKEFLESLIANSVIPIVAADGKGLIQIFNKAAERLTGYAAGDIVGRMSVLDLYAEDGARNVMRRIRSTNYGGRGRLEPCVSVIRDRSGEEIPIMLSAWLLYDAAGNETASIGFFEDLRERVRIEKDMAQMREQVMERERQQTATAVAGAASHELNQPLTAILGSVQLLQQLLDAKPDLARVLERIRSETERMGKIVNDLGKVKELQTRRYAGRTTILDLEKGKGR